MSEKRIGNRDRLLALLSDYQEHSMSECQRHAGFRYGARLFELRRMGYVIDTVQKGVDVFAYRMVPEHELQLSLI